MWPIAVADRLPDRLRKRVGAKTIRGRCASLASSPMTYNEAFSPARVPTEVERSATAIDREATEVGRETCESKRVVCVVER